jgi:hypothetical protein
MTALLWTIGTLTVLGAIGVIIITRRADRDSGHDPLPWRPTQKQPTPGRFPDPRRFCNICAEDNLIQSFSSDAALNEHLHTRHGDS